MKSVCTCSRVVRTASVVVLALNLAVSARAQEADATTSSDPQTTVDDTVSPAQFKTIEDPVPAKRKKTARANPYDPVGLRLGSFTLYPTLELSGVADSNLARSSTAPKHDIGLGVKPGFRLQSDWSRHELVVSSSADVLHYLDNSDLSTRSATAAARLRLDIRHDVTAETDISYGLTSDGASNSEVPDTAIGNRTTQTYGAALAVTHDGGVVALKAKAAAARSVYSDVKLSGGGTEDNGDRNYTEYELSLRGSLNTGATLRPFAEAAYVPRNVIHKVCV
jgi:hypothetical protein